MTRLKFTTLFGGAIFGIGLAAYGAKQSWTDWQQVSIAGIVAIATLIMEACVFLVETKSEIEKLSAFNPSNLLKKTTGVEHRIAVSEYESAKRNLELAFDGSDFVCSDLLHSNSILLKSLHSGQHFKALTMLNDPELWEIDTNLKSYLELNIDRASSVNIERIFIFKDDEDMMRMEPIVKKQKNANITIYQTTINTIESSKFNKYLKFPDFSLAPEINLALYVETDQKLDRVWVTKNQDKLRSLNTQFSAIVSLIKNHENQSAQY